MYNQPYFVFKGEEHLQSFLSEHLFGLLIVLDKDSDELLMSHLPFEIEIKDNTITYFGHVAVQNPIASKIKSRNTAYIVIQGEAHHYVSSEWYTKITAPTWNYQAAHIKGVLLPLSKTELHTHLGRMIALNESRYNQSKLSISDIPHEMVQSMMKEIVGFSFQVQTLDAVNKMSQNRDAASIQNILSKLKESGRDGALNLYGVE